MEEIILRKCNLCKIKKPLESFYRHKNETLGRSYQCKECKKIYAKTYVVKYRHSKHGQEVIQKSEFKNKANRMLRNTCRRAKKLNLEFNLTIEDIIIPDVCPVLGIPIIKNSKGITCNSPSIDRIDNSKGYVKRNVCVISNRANVIKSFGSIEEHQKVIDYMKHYCLDKEFRKDTFKNSDTY